MKISAPVLKMILTWIISIVLVSSAYSQVKPYDFPKIKPADFGILSYDKDTSAAAVILGDKGESSFEYSDIKGFQLVFTRHLRIRILTKEGYDFATLSIPLYRNNGSAESLSELKGYTYNLVNGKVENEKLGRNNIFEEQVTANWQRTKLTMPNVKAGSILDIRYKIVSDFFWNLQEWKFQNTVPTQWSEYTVTIPEYYIYSKLIHGSVPLVISDMTTSSGSVSLVIKERSDRGGQGLGQNTMQTTYDHRQVNFKQNTYHFAACDVPAIKEESFAPAMTNFISKVEFELDYIQFPGEGRKNYTTTWQDICDGLIRDENFGEQLQRTRVVNDAVKLINTTASTPIGKMIAAHDFIRSKMLWNGKNGVYTQNGVSKAYNEKTGNAADINLLLLILLKEVGLDAAPVILSTRENGLLVESHPVLTQINYVLASATIDGKTYLLDATGKYRPANFLPSRCLNGSGLLVSRNESRWIPLLGEEKENTLYHAEMRITPEGTISGELNVSKSGYSAEEVRAEFNHDGSEKYFASLKEKYKDWKIDDIKVNQVDSLSIPVNLHYTLSSEEAAQVNGNLIYLNPLLGFGQQNNPFKAEKRNNVVDFIYPVKETYVFKFELPEAFTIESMPQTVKLTLPDQAGSFLFMVSTEGSTLNINSTLTLTKTMYTAAEYSDLREFFTRIVTKHAQQIILKKI